MNLLLAIYVITFIIFAIGTFILIQIKSLGLNIKDFWKFIEANSTLDELYEFTSSNNELNIQQQLVFLLNAEKVFNAFDKVPVLLWEDEYNKYNRVLDKYRDIKILRWER